MKKEISVLFGVVCVLLFANCSNNGRFEFDIPDNISKQYDLDQRYIIFQQWAADDPSMVDKIPYIPDSLKYIVLLPLNLQIRNVFTGKEEFNIYNPKELTDLQKFSLYTINTFSGRRQLLLFNNGEIIVFNCDDYTKAVKDILHYFKRHNNLDKRLLPLCIQEITKIYVGNSLNSDQFGPWRHWWGEEADSLGKIYNQYLQYK